MPKVDNQVNLRVNLDFKSISTHRTKAAETIMVMKKKMVKMNAKKKRLTLSPGPRL